MREREDVRRERLDERFAAVGGQREAERPFVTATWAVYRVRLNVCGARYPE